MTPQIKGPVHHDLALHSTSRYGCWATCSCGWRSRRWTTTTGAHLQFGEQLLGGDA